MKKRIVLCADDYGQTPAISQGIINLLERNRLSATSCLVNSPYWLEHSQWLKPFYEQADLGLHFNLTEGKALSPEYIRHYGEYFQPLSALLMRVYSGRLKSKIVEAECHAQLNQFQKNLGRIPDYLDGHHHIHQFPVIRNAVLAVYQQRLQAEGVYIRLVQSTSKPLSLKKLIILLVTQSAYFKKHLDKMKIQYNQSFNGIYNFAHAAQYAQFFADFLKNSQDQGLIMCNPGYHSDEKTDAMSASRWAEYQYLMSDLFLKNCEDSLVEIGRLNR